jgi:hypothetical protein
MENLKSLEHTKIPINPEKPLGHRSYGHIAHLPGSRTGPRDHHISEGQAKICCLKTRDKHDLVIVQEKLDGSNVGIAKIRGEIIPLIRAGYKAITSRFEMHRLFHQWVTERETLFQKLLSEGERCCGEWLLQAHGTRYNLPHEPFVAFDIMHGQERKTWNEVEARCAELEVKTAYTPHKGGPLSIRSATELIGAGQHGAIDPVEGAVWRVERKGTVDFLAKYVKLDKVDGAYLPEITKEKAIWNTYATQTPKDKN